MDADLNPPRGCKVNTVEFDFDRKVCRDVAVADLYDRPDDAPFIWIDVAIEDEAATRVFLESLGLAEDETLSDAILADPVIHHVRVDSYLYLALTGCRVVGNDLLHERVSAVMGRNFLLTLHRGPVRFLETILREYRSDFVNFAKAPSFMFYELWDHAVQSYVYSQHHLEGLVEGLQQDLMEHVDGALFRRVSELGHELSRLRRLLLPARAVLTELSTRKSPYISDETRPFLANMAMTVERVIQDLVVDRELLAESLNLLMSLNTHRTNEVMRRLTLVSVVFLPLTFLCGVYGMNFVNLPETQWEYGYAYFWGLASGVLALALLLLRRAKIL